jgi:hypothetical protein
MLCVSLASEISVPAPKILVRGEADSEELESNAVVEEGEFQHTY